MEFFSTLNAFDYTLLGIAFLAFLLGLKRGFVAEIIALFIWVLAFFLSLSFADALSARLMLMTGGNYPSVFAAFLLIFIVTILVGVIFNYIIVVIVGADKKGVIDRVLGGLLGVLRSGLIAVFIVFCIVNTHWQESNWFQTSRLAYPLQDVSTWIQGKILNHKPLNNKLISKQQ